MKKISLLFLLLLLADSILHADCASDNDNYVSSKSYMATRPVIQHPSLYWAVWHDIVYPHNEYRSGSVQATTIGEWSMLAQETARYFLPNCQDIQVVAGDHTPEKNTRNIRAEWLGLPANYYGSFEIAPQQYQGGVIFEFNKNLTKMVDFIPSFANSWLSVSFPVIAVENCMHFKQIDGQPGYDNQEGTGTLYDAFNQPNWDFAHLRNHTSTLQLAEVNIKLGRAYMAKNHFLVAYYSTFTIPTGNNQDPRFTFDAVSGNNGHWGYGAGVNFQLLLPEDPYDYATCIFLTLESTFFPRNEEQRTYDLKGKPWSRYLQFVTKNGSGIHVIPGVNVLTLVTRVHAYNFVEFSTGIRLKSTHTESEICFSVWGHADEWNELRCPFPSCTYGIAGRPAADGSPRTASNSTIAYQADNDVNADDEPVFVAICESDINLESAEAKSALNQKVHISFGYINETECFTGFANIGAYFDYPQRNSALKTIGFWTKLGVSF